MAELMLMTPMGLYGALHSIAAHVEAGEWTQAAQWSTNTGDEGRRLMAAAPRGNEDDWHRFLTTVDELSLTVNAKDVEGCHEAFADLRACLVKIAGTETGPAV